MCWLRNYLIYAVTRGADQFDYSLIEEFLEANEQFEHTMHYNYSACALNQPSCIIGYKFTTAVQVGDFPSFINFINFTSIV